MTMSSQINHHGVREELYVLQQRGRHVYEVLNERVFSHIIQAAFKREIPRMKRLIKT